MSKLHVKLSLCSTALGHQMSVLGGTSDLYSSSENLNTLAVLCFTLQGSFLQKTNKREDLKRERNTIIYTLHKEIEKDERKKTE